MSKPDLIITDKAEYPPYVAGVIRFSNSQWRVCTSKLEGCEFNDVIVRCRLDDDLRDWLHMHIGIRINRIIYENPFEQATKDE